jgi:2-oxoglutarate ferredoxin oxidoreductase subunit beta
MNKEALDIKLTAKDFTSDQEVRWCPGCGDFAILKCMQRTLPALGATPENTVFISGIGCSSRFPYYMETYGFHTIHGRAPAVATGVKLANPDLDVWVVTGDGDGLSIGGNHLLHAIRRNVDLNILLFNNEIYGLTKGQYSPTSGRGTITPSSPHGSLEAAIIPCAFVLGSGARFVARTVDTAQKHMPEIFKAARDNKGASFVEIYQNCIVYNDAVFSNFTEKKVAADRQIMAQHGEPFLFGSEKNKGIRLNPKTLTMEVITVGEDGITLDDVLVHDETNIVLAQMLVSLDSAIFPVVLGIIYRNPTTSFGKEISTQKQKIRAKKKKGNLLDLMKSGGTWEVK